jgi:LmbE family N-acetylglucosaminyl deacetylase
LTPDTPTGNWATPQNILVILAHPDDPEFFCGATLARWTRAGHSVSYYLLTCGNKGFHEKSPPDLTPAALCTMRKIEQTAAAEIIGARAVHFSDREDGYLVPDLDLRLEIVAAIRRFQPDILVTCDPQTLFATYGINHPDHRAAGQAVLDAVFPAAGNKEYFPELLARGLQPHMPEEIWCSLTTQPDVVLDVSETWPIKIQAVLQHKSQIGDVEELKKRMASRRTEDSTDENPRYEEKFRVVKYG